MGVQLSDRILTGNVMQQDQHNMDASLCCNLDLKV